MDNIKDSDQQPSKVNINLEKQLKQFQDTEGLTTQKLDFGLWYVEHLKQFKQALIICLAIIAAVSWVYTIYGFAYYIASGMKQDDALIQDISQVSGASHDLIYQSAPKDINFFPVEIFKSVNSKYDLAAKIQNVNSKSWAEFNYYFLADGQPTQKQPGFVLPGESKYLLTLAVDLPARPTNAQLVIENVSWRRVNQHQISNWQEYSRTHLAINNEDIKFTPANQNELSQELGLNQLSFSSSNKTPFNYWQVNFIILFHGGNTLISVDKYSLTDFMSGQKRIIELSWPGNIGRVDKIDIIPEINIMDDDIYIKYEGGTGEEK